ncbi:MAG: hypothetical protein WD826_06160 [Actinomycetota bacterium]
MKGHRFDAISFVFGIAFLGLAVALSIDTVDLGGVGLRWIAAGTLLVLGLVMLLGNTTRSDDRS